MEPQTQQPMEPQTQQQMEPQTQQQMEPQTQQLMEDGGSNKAAGSSASMLCRRSGTRWIPTTDQIRILKGLYYDKGVKSPTTEQIQRICFQLNQYGEIEGKNVFYWFQNHKAREKLKKRFTSGVHVPMGTSSTDAGGSINLNFGSTSSAGVGRSINLNFGSWVGCSVDPYSSSPFTTSTGTTFFGMNEEQTFMEQRGGDHQEIETLPLFPMHGEDIFGNMKTTSEGGSGYGHYSGGWGGYNGGSHISLELSLNPPGAADLA